MWIKLDNGCENPLKIVRSTSDVRLCYYYIITIISGISVKKLECCIKSIFRILDKILWPHLGAGRLSIADTITELTIVQKLRFLFNIFSHIAVVTGSLALL